MATKKGQEPVKPVSSRERFRRPAPDPSALNQPISPIAKRPSPPPSPTQRLTSAANDLNLRCLGEGVRRHPGIGAIAQHPRKRGALAISRAIVAASVGMLAGFMEQSARADQWDPVPNNGVVNGGPGTWITGTPAWTADGGATNINWSNGNAAVFGGTSGGSVMVSGLISASSLQFDVTTDLSTYTITSASWSDTLTLTGPSIIANQDALLSVSLAGSNGLTKSGAATLTLASGSNTISGAILINAGTLSISTDTNLGSGANGVTVQNGAILKLTASIDPGGAGSAAGSSARVFTVGAGGGTFDVAPAATFTIDEDGQLAGIGQLTKTGTGRLLLGAPGIGNINFSGNLTISAGSVEVAGGAAAGTGAIRVDPAGTLINNSSIIANPINLTGGALRLAGSDGTFGGAVTVGANSSIVAPIAGKTLTVGGTVTGASALTIDVGGGGNVALTSAANFDGSANTFTGNVSVISSGGSPGSAALRYRIAASAGQTFSATAGTLSLGNSLAGATVSLANGSIVQASGAGAIELSGRSAAPGFGVAISGTLNALSGGKITVGDGLDDGGQIQFTNTAILTADAGTIVLKPRLNALTLDATNLGTLNIRNGGMLALAGNADFSLNKDVAQTGAWVLANQSANLFKIVSGSQDTTAGLTLRADSGVIQYEATTLNIGSAAANGTVALDLRGGTVDIRNDVAATFTYTPGTVTGWGQIGTSVANQTHIVPAGGLTLYANAPATNAGTLSIVGAIDESAGTKAGFKLGDNDGIMLSVPNGTQATRYIVNSAVVDAQGAGNYARFIVGGGFVQANASAFTGAANRVRFEVAGGGTLVSDVSSVGTLLLTGSLGSNYAIRVTNGASFITTSSTFLLNSTETIGGAGTLFAFNGTATTALTLKGTLALNGTMGASIVTGSTGTIALNAGETLTLLNGADLTGVTLSYGGLAALPATIEANASSGTVRLGATPIATAGGFIGSRQFTATAGTLQVDAADAPQAVTISGAGVLTLDRSADAVNNPTTLGTLVLNGGTFQIGTAASTTTVTNGATLSGKGIYGHATAIDTFINQGIVSASGGPLTISAGTIRATGTFNPNGQTLTIKGFIADIDGANKTTLKIIGGAGGLVQITPSGGTNGTYTGGTIIDGSSTGTLVNVRVTASGSLGTGPVTINSGQLTINSDTGINLSANTFTVTGTAPSVIAYDRATTVNSKTHSLGALTLDGPTLTLAGANAHTINFNGLTITPLGGKISSTGSAQATFTFVGAMAVNGPVILEIAGNTFNTSGLSGSGSITRTFNSGALNFNLPGNSFTGFVTSSGGTTNFNGSNALGTGTYLFGGGTININTANALSGASGTGSGSTIQLGAVNSLNGTVMTLSGGTVFANVANSLGSATMNLAGGQLFMRADGSQTFGGAITVGGTKASSLVVDRALNGVSTNGTHSIASLAMLGQTLTLLGNNGYSLNVPGGITVGGSGTSALTSAVANLISPTLAINQGLTLNGSGLMTIGQVSGTSGLTMSGVGTLTISNPAAAGFTSAVQAGNGLMNLNGAGGSLAGGSLAVNGGEVDLNAANALAGTPTALSSGFLVVNSANALSGGTVVLTNGSMLAMTGGALGNGTVQMAGGNLTAYAANALATANINMTGGVLALRSDVTASMGGNVSISGTNFVTISVAPLGVDPNAAGNTLSISTLALGGQTLNVTGASNYILSVDNPIAMSGTSATTFNTTAADAIFQGALTGAGPLIKTGMFALTLNTGGTFAATTVGEGTLVVNGQWTTAGVTIGSSTAAATLQMGGSGVNAPGAIALNSGTLRINKTTIANAIPAATAIAAGASGDATVEYGGSGAGVMPNGITMTLTSAARTLTLSGAGITGGTAGGSFLYSGFITRSGTNALTVVGRADAPLDDGAGNLLRTPGRLIMGGSQTFSTNLFIHGGGVVIGKGNVPTGSNTAGPFGMGSNAVTLNFKDSTIGAMVADGQSSANFDKPVTTAAPAAPRMRFGAYFNPAGAAGQIINMNSTFAWNDGNTPLLAERAPGQWAGSAANSSWNGFHIDSGVAVQLLAGTQLDNILTASGGVVTSTAPIYVGGGGTLRITSAFGDNTYRNLSTNYGIAGTVTALDSTTIEARSSLHHFDSVELRTGTYWAAGVNQNVTGGFAVNASPFDSTRTTSNVITDFNLGLTGIGAAKAFKIGGGQTLVKSGAASLLISGDQSHSAGSTLQVTQGTVVMSTDAGTNFSGSPVNNLALNVSTSTVTMNVSQHLANVVVGTGGSVTLAASASTGGKVLDITGLSITDTGKLDIANNALVIDYAPGNSPLAAVRAMLSSSYNFNGARWSGNSLTSATAKASPSSLSIGYGEASTILGGSGGTFYGQTVDASAIVARVTVIGDANLDGTTGLADLLALANNYGTSGATWATGDFDYDGTVGLNDLLLLANNYGLASPGAPVGASSFAADAETAFSSVPEPGGLVFVLGAFAALGQRRRRSRS